MKPWYFIIPLVFVIVSCSGSRTVTLNALRPAEITFDPSVNTILIVDRTKFDKKAVNIIEGILTGELPQEDLAGIQSFISAFQLQLNQSPRLNAKIATEKLTGNSVTSAFPTQLSWSRVNQLCRKYNAQVLLALEIYDSDMLITDGKRVVERTIKSDSTERVVKVDEYYAEGVANITIGLKLYDPENETIVDRQLFKRSNSWEAAADSKREALAKLINKGDANRYLSEAVGSSYAYRVAPMTIQITRSFRGKHKKAPELERGSRHADVGNWDMARRVWESGIRNAPKKQQGYFAYNIALAYEVMGDLQSAREWAQKAYTQYGNKDARNYSYTLSNRMADETKLQQQMN